ncbi:MAG: 50S ribosomal protein L6 [uncultured bacterium]|nr:MAG: 50S ribosomal protein L6 [uncultured bacterium]OGT37166.1 MAG: 50S ribosomal protein L6 [Gammaproteobacteria bacterium RIFCSPHIGHO2_12_FULL_38_14]
MASRVAKNPVSLPANVDVKISDLDISIKGKLGELNFKIPEHIKIAKKDGFIHISAANDATSVNALAGTSRALIQNMVSGVSEGFIKKLILIGVGYRAKAQGNTLDLTVGLSHPVLITMPKGIHVETPSNTEIILKGADKQMVCQVAANIRAVRPPEPYKGKGIRYLDEVIELKEGKKK